MRRVKMQKQRQNSFFLSPYLELFISHKSIIFTIKLKMHYSFKSTPTVTFKSRTETITKSNQPSSLPGPGNYEFKKPLPQSATVAITKQKRQLWKIKNDAPGPGSYQSKSFITAGPKRSMSAKIIRQPPKTPGPAAYQTKDLNLNPKAPVYSMGKKSKSPQKIIQEHNNYKPSPGIYQTKSSFLRSSGVVFGSSNRKDLTQTERTPAPGHYQSENTVLTQVINPRCVLGTQKRQLKISVAEKTPGPGSYEKKTFIEQSLISQKGFSCRQKLRDLIAQEISKVPAPGHYLSQSLVLQQTAPRCATSHQRRLTFIDTVQSAKKDIPAFVENQQSLFRSSKFRASSAVNFGKSRRKSLDEDQKTPGPVAYSNEKLQIMRRQPSFSCPKTIPKNEFLKVMDPQNPGPGNYDPKIDLVRKSLGSIVLTKQKRPNFQKQKQKPGPGQYNLIKQHQPKFGWTKEKRLSFTDLKSEAKHGSHYNLSRELVNPPSYMKPNKVQLGIDWILSSSQVFSYFSKF